MNAALEEHTASGRSGLGLKAPFTSRLWLTRWGALMGGTGAALVAASFATPGSMLTGANPVPVAIIGAVCLSFTVLPAVRGERIRDAEVLVIALISSAMIAYLGMVTAERPGSEKILMLLTWPTLIAAMYLPRPMVVAQVLAGAAAGTLVLQATPTTPAVAALQTSLLAATLTIVAVVVTQLRESLIDALDRAHDAATTDALTGLANRRGIAERMPALLASTARRGESVEVLIVDIDHFKAVNDHHGHGVGDLVLAQVADIIRSTVRADDLVGRFGGEEFLVLAAVAPGDAPARVGDRIRRAVQEQSSPVSVTVSVGSTTLVPRQGVDVPKTLDQQVDVADQAMYESKSAGRNCVTRR